MYRATQWIAGLAVVLIAGSGCYPDQYDSVNYDSVATLYDTSAVFHTATTFALADSVVHLGGGTDDIPRTYDAQILARIRLNMTNAGYTEVATPATANLDLVALVTTSTYAGYYWDAWCGYYGYWYPGYACYYPPYWGVYSYTVGTLLIGMSDNRAAVSAKAPMIWFAGISGLMNQASSQSRVTSTIDQAFAQSPYIHHP